MASTKATYIKGAFTHRRTEADYMGVLLDAVTLEEWGSVVTATVEAAKAGDASARAWLAQYLVGKPGVTAPAPLTVVVQQLSGSDPVVDRLAQPHLARLEALLFRDEYGREDAVKAQVAAELRALEAEKSHVPKTGDNADTAAPSPETLPKACEFTK
jgi:hypothetical protein